MNVIAKISCYLERGVVTLKLRKEYLNSVTRTTSFLLRIKYWTIWCIERYSMSTYTEVTNCQKTVRFFWPTLYIGTGCIHKLTMTSFVIIVCGQRYRLHVVGQQVVSDISEFHSCWHMCSLCFENNNTNPYYACSVMYFECLFCFKYQT